MPKESNKNIIILTVIIIFLTIGVVITSNRQVAAHSNIDINIPNIDDCATNCAGDCSGDCVGNGLDGCSGDGSAHCSNQNSGGCPVSHDETSCGG